MEFMLIGGTASFVVVLTLATLWRRSRQRRCESMPPGRTVIAANLVGSRRKVL